MSEERDAAVEKIGRAVWGGPVGFFPCSDAKTRMDEAVDAILAAAVVAVRAEKKSEAKAPCRTCQGHQFVCDTPGPDVGCGKDICSANRRPCPDCCVKPPCKTCGDAWFVCNAHGFAKACPFEPCNSFRRPCPDCSAAPKAKEEQPMCDTPYEDGATNRRMANLLDTVEHPASVPEGSPGSLHRRAWDLGRTLVSGREFASEVARLRTQSENDAHVIRLQNDRNVELQGDVAKLRARVEELEREERNGWPRTRAALKTRAGECVVDAACRVEQELAQANAKVKELEDGYPLRELRTALGIVGTQESLMTAATRIMAELAQAKDSASAYESAARYQTDQVKEATARVTELEATLADAKGQSAKMFDADAVTGARIVELEASLAEAKRIDSRAVSSIIYRATVECVSSTDVTLELLPATDGEMPIQPVDGLGRIQVNVPGAANAEDVGETLRAFGSLIGMRGSVRVQFEPDQRSNILRDEADRLERELTKEGKT